MYIVRQTLIRPAILFLTVWKCCLVTHAKCSVLIVIFTKVVERPMERTATPLHFVYSASLFLWCVFSFYCQFSQVGLVIGLVGFSTVNDKLGWVSWALNCQS